MAFALQTFSRAFIVVDYVANTAAFAKNCENKAKPKLQCNGKCQMMKKMAKEEKKDQENPDRKAENKSENVLSSKSFFTAESPVNTGTYVVAKYPIYTAAREIKMPRSFFHPPNC